MYGPLFRNGTFEFVPIPEKKVTRGDTYGEIKGKKTGQLLSSFFPPRRQPGIATTIAHYDPEFDTFTYGDPTVLKRRLRKLQAGDLLVFYVGLQPYDFEDEEKRGLYIIGYFQVEAASESKEFKDGLYKLFGNNFHVKFRKNERGLTLVKGSLKSRLLERAYPISKIGRDRGGHKIYVLSDEAQKHFGCFTKLNAIQRCVPRWVRDTERDPERTRQAAEWIRGLA
jgi:hypothetical protein